VVRREGRGLATRAFALLTTLRIFAWMQAVAHDDMLAPFLAFRRDSGWSGQPLNLAVVGVGVGAILLFLFAGPFSLLATGLGLRNRRRRSTAMIMVLPLSALATAFVQHRLLPHPYEVPFPGTAPTSFAALAASLPFLSGFFAGGVLALGTMVQLAARSHTTLRPLRSVRTFAEAARRVAVSVPRRDPFAPLLVLVGALAVAIAFVPPSPSHVQAFTLLDAVYLGGTLIALVRYLLGRGAIIGADGVLLGTAPQRFVPFAQVDRAVVRDEGLELSHQGERLMRLEVSPADPGALQETLRRVELAMKELREGEVERAALALPRVDETDSPVSSHAYRQGQLSTEELWRLVEAGATPADVRVRAAARIAASAEVHAQTARAGQLTRLRIAAETCLAPGVSEALEALAEEESALVLSSRG
jgi:hypothetical protein